MSFGAIEAGKAVVNISLDGVKRVQRQLAMLMAKIKSFASGAKKAMKFAFSGLASIGRGGLAAGSAGVAGGGFLLKLAADAEKTQIVFKNLIGSAGQARTLLKDLNEFADSTPFQNEDIQQSAKILLASGTAVKDINSEMKLLATLAAKADSEVNFLASKLLDIRGKGKIEGTDLKEFGRLGIDLRGALGQVTRLDQSDLQKRISSPLGKGAITPEEVDKALRLVADQLPGIIDEMSMSTAGLTSTLTGQVRALGKELGKMLNESLGIKQFLADMISFTKENREVFKSGFKDVIVELVTFTEALKMAAKKIREIFELRQDLRKRFSVDVGGKRFSPFDSGFEMFGTLFGAGQQNGFNDLREGVKTRIGTNLATAEANRRFAEQNEGAAKQAGESIAKKIIEGATTHVRSMSMREVQRLMERRQDMKKDLKNARDQLEKQRNQSSFLGTFSGQAASRFLGSGLGQNPLLLSSKNQEASLKTIEDRIRKLEVQLG